MKELSKITWLLILCLLHLSFSGTAKQLHPFTKIESGKNFTQNLLTNSIQKDDKRSQQKDASQLKSTHFLTHSLLINTPLVSASSAVDIRGFLDALFISFFDNQLLNNRYTNSAYAKQPIILQHALRLIFPHHSFW